VITAAQIFFFLLWKQASTLSKPLRISSVVIQHTNLKDSTIHFSMASEALARNDYTVGWVCALPKELIAATAMLDDRHPDLPKPPNDQNAYTLGRVGEHNVVIACLPKGEIGNSNSATVATRMTSTFPSIKFGLMVGIGGGVPKFVRLGDVVVSTPTDEFGGVVQWDFGKAEQGGTFKRTGALNNPPATLLTALTNLERDHAMTGSKIPQYLEDLKKNWSNLAPMYTRSESLKDVLFRADYNHVEKSAIGNVDTLDNADEEGGEEEEEEKEENDCTNCDPSKIVRRKARNMRVNYGLIASGNQVIKDAAFRDEINKRLGGKVLCFEMEAAGLMNDFPCIVIRGICDYADSHKNKAWQEHAAAVAAAFAKEFLSVVPKQEVDHMPTIKGNTPF
jgi:nucleoside phosphorylase